MSHIPSQKGEGKKKYRVNFSKLIETIKKRSDTKNINEIEMLEQCTNICLTCENIDISNKINAYTLNSFFNFTKENYDEVFYILRKIIKIAKISNGIEHFIFIRTFWRGGTAYLKNKNFFYSFYYLTQCDKIKGNSKITDQAREVLDTNKREAAESLKKELHTKKDLLLNIPIDKVNKIDEILKKNDQDFSPDSEVYLINKRWKKKAEVFWDFYSKICNEAENKDKLQEFIQGSFDIKEVYGLFSLSIDSPEKAEKSYGFYPGIIDNIPLLIYQSHWKDPRKPENSVFLNPELKMGVDFECLDKSSWTELTSIFDATNEIKREYKNIFLKDQKALVLFPELRIKNQGSIKRKHLQYSNDETVKDFKEKLLKSLLKQVGTLYEDLTDEDKEKKSKEEKTKEEETKKEEAKNEESKEEETKQEETKEEETKNEESKEEETKQEESKEEEPKQEEPKQEETKQEETKQEEAATNNILDEYDINFYLLPRESKNILFEILIAYINAKENSFSTYTIPGEKVQISDDSKMSEFPEKSKKYVLIVDIKEKGGKDFIILRTGACSKCGKKECSYVCDKCSYSTYCSSKCAEEDPKHKDFHRKLDDFLIEEFDLQMLMKTKLSSILGNEYRHGLVGINNYGNTCYLNSAIQCLSNTEDLTKYFLLSKYEQELNLANRLGSSGGLARAYNSLLIDLWKSQSRYIAPRDFLLTVQRRIQISINSQQDSQEFVSLFLDNLHEDLNRISNKPYIEMKEQQENETDLQASARWWGMHKQREDSIITDLFHGQFRTKIICPRCNKKNITYDPFMFLSMNIPSDNSKITFKFFYNETEGDKVTPKCKQFEQAIFQNLNVYDLKYKCKYFLQKVKEDQSTKANASTLSESTACTTDNNFEEPSFEAVSFNKMIQKSVTDNEDVLKHYSKGEEICIYEVESKNKFNIYIYPVIFGEEDKSMWGGKEKKIKYLSYPIPISVEITQSLSLLYDNILKALDSILLKEGVEQVQKESILELFIYHNQLPRGIFFSKIECEFCRNKTRDPFCKLFSYAKMSDQVKKVINAMESSRILVLLCTSKHFDVTKTIYSFSLPKNPSSSSLISKPKNISIYDVLDLFSCEEKLEKENSWYCSKCKEHQEANKTMEIYKTPLYLIFHFKRFKVKTNNSVTRYFLNKKNTIFIGYPIKNLDMRKYIIGPESKNAIYDLYGVVQHSGGLDSGHYTAYCKNFGQWYEYNDTEISEVSEKDVVTSRAYMLFYKKKNIDGINNI